MKQLNITVLSNKPAGGRCTLYANYAQTLSTTLGFSMQTLYPDENHTHSAPGLLLDGDPVLPNDGVIIDADDICNAIERTGLDIADLTEVRKKLDSLIEEMMNGV
jgi:hypothetical protein